MEFQVCIKPNGVIETEVTTWARERALVDHVQGAFDRREPSCVHTPLVDSVQRMLDRIEANESEIARLRALNGTIRAELRAVQRLLNKPPQRRKKKP